MIKAVIDALKPEQVKSNYRQGSESGAPSALLSEPVGDDADYGELKGNRRRAQWVKWVFPT